MREEERERGGWRRDVGNNKRYREAGRVGDRKT